MQKAVDEFGQLDIVVNNADLGRHGAQARPTSSSGRCSRSTRSSRSASSARRPRTCAARVRPTRRPGREVFRKVVNVTSVSGTQGNVGQANYSAGKAGLVGLTKTLAKEWGPFKVNVNAVAFGFVETRLTASSDEGGETFVRDEVEIPLGIPERLRQLAPMIIPFGRPATPRDAAGLIFFLCSPCRTSSTGRC